jgi:O-antigen/teichoic acid export membrane protein
MGLTRHLSPLSGMTPVLVGLVLWNVGNYAFFVLAGRATGPKGYATLAALLAIGLLIQIPAGAIQVGFSRRVAALPRQSPEAAWLLRRVAAHGAVWGTVVALIAGAVTWLVAPSFPDAAVAWMAVSLAPIPLQAVAVGMLQGEQRFGAVATTLSMLGVPRPLLLLACLPFMAAVTAAMAGSALTMVVAAAVGLLLAFPRGVPRADPPPRELWRAFLRTFGVLAVGLAGIGFLLNLDVLVARASLDAHTAGLFGAVAVLAKATVIIPQAVALVLLPRVSASHEKRERTGNLLVLGLAVTVVTSAVGVVIALLAGRPIVELVFGTEFADGADYLPALIATTGLTGLVLVLMNHQVARGIDRYNVVVAIMAVVEGCLFAAFHGSVSQLLMVEFIVGGLAVAIYEALFFRSEGGICHSVRATFSRLRALSS